MRFTASAPRRQAASRCGVILRFRGTNSMLRTVEIKLYPTPAQAETLNAWIGICCLTYNRALENRIKAYERRGQSVGYIPDSDYWRRLLMDAQVSRYYLAARELGFDVQTTVYDVTRKPAIRPKAISKSDRAMATALRDYHGLPVVGGCPERETPQMFGARVLATMTDEPDRFFARNEIPRLDSDLEQFRLDQWATLKAISACDLDGYYPRNTNACVSPYRCTYLDVCRGLAGDPDEQIPEGFRRVKALHPELTPAVAPEGTER